MEGFLVNDIPDRAQAERALIRWQKAGLPPIPMTVTACFENAPGAISGMLSGGNRGMTAIPL